MFLGSAFMAAEAFRTRIVALRKAHGLSQEDLARLVGVSKGAVQQWEAGTSVPRGTHLAIIGETFQGWSVDYLLGVPNAAAPTSRAASADDGAADLTDARQSRGLGGLEALAAEESDRQRQPGDARKRGRPAR